MSNIMICIPGAQWYSQMAKSLFSLVAHITYKYENKFGIQLVDAYSANVFQCRNSLLGIPKNVLNQKPFRDAEYSYILFIDTDIVFSPYHFDRLFARDKDIVAGFYLQRNGVDYSAAVDFIPENGSNRWIHKEDLKDQSDLIPLDWAGMGFMLVKQGVFESLGYPWFKEVEVKTRVFTHYSSEDAGFCLRAKEKGCQTWGDPTVKVAHIKTVELV